MDAHDKFIETNRKRLLEYLDPATADDIEEHPLNFATRVLDEWTERFGMLPLPPPSLAERAFWFALFQLEELEECRLVTGDDPLLIFMEANLERMRTVLSEGADIPAGFWATRPNGDDADVILDLSGVRIH